MFIFIINIFNSVAYSLWIMLLTIITGKTCKVSPYHFAKESDDYNFFNICSDKFIKTNYARNVSDKCKGDIIMDFLLKLEMNNKFHKVAIEINFPIFDGKEVIGKKKYYHVLIECLEDYIKSEKNK